MNQIINQMMRKMYQIKTRRQSRKEVFMFSQAINRAKAIHQTFSYNKIKSLQMSNKKMQLEESVFGQYHKT